MPIPPFPWLDDGLTEYEQQAIRSLRDIVRESPAVAEILLDFPWLADGVTKDESYAIYHIRVILREDSTVAETVSGFPWLADGVNGDESHALYNLRELMREYPAAAETLLGFQWLADGVTRSEGSAINSIQEIFRADPAAADAFLGSAWLADGVTWGESQSLKDLSGPYLIDRYGLSALDTKPWFKDGFSDEELTAVGHLISIASRFQTDAQAITDMPFLESVESRDTLALRSLDDIAWRDASVFSELMSHPRIKDGITDEETKIVAVLGKSTIHQGAPGSTEILLAETGVYIEERLIELPHTGETLLAVIRTQDKVTSSMDDLEHAVRTIEEFMGVPYPIDYLALLFYDRDFGASNNFTHLHMMPERDVVDGPWWYAGVIAHETAHWYWRNNSDRFQYQHWIVEGGADFLRIISEHERIGRQLKPIGGPCRYFDSISELEKANPTRVNPASECENSLGQGLFLDLYFLLGDETFRSAYRTLYLRSRQENPVDGCGGPPLNICRVEAAFKDGASAEVVAKVEEVIDHWYYGK